MTATRLDRWTCPLCDWTIAAVDATSAALVHGTITHPVTLPSHMTTVDRLRLLPVLAREIALTVGAPNRTGGDTDRVCVSAHPKLPIDGAALDVLAPEDGDHPDRPLTLLVEASRIVWESIDDELRAEHPQPAGVPAYRSECGWLAGIWDDALAWLDMSDIHWIEGMVADLTGQLATVARMSRETRYACPDCGQPMHLGEGDWMVCETGAHMHPGPHRLESEWRRKGPMGTNALAAELHLPAATLRKWKERGKVAPLRREGGTDIWLPWDVISVLYPDVVAAIDGRDSQVA